MVVLSTMPVLAEKRSALVIGNDSYEAATPLKNAKNDARAMAAELKKLGFEVILSVDASAPELESTVKNWTSGLRSTDVALLFYAGHGVQVEGVNYLVPVDFNGDELDVKHSCLSAEMIRERMEKSGPDTNIIILDACRNNPFATTRGGSRGLVFMEGGVGTVIAFATSPGGVSADNPDGQNGLFTKHLLANLSTPGLDALQVFQNVGRGVYSESGGSQKPWISASVMPRNFCFVPMAEAPASGSLGIESPPVVEQPVVEQAVVPTLERGNSGRLPKKNVVLLLVGENASRTAWLVDLARERIFDWYGNGPNGMDFQLNVEYISCSDPVGWAMVQKTFALERGDLPAMISALKVDGKFTGSVATHKRVKEKTDLGRFFDTIFEPRKP